MPEKYIQRNGNEEYLNDAFPVMDIPAIDLGLLMTSSGVEQELEKLQSAFNAWGSIQV